MKKEWNQPWAQAVNQAAPVIGASQQESLVAQLNQDPQAVLTQVGMKPEDLLAGQNGEQAKHLAPMAGGQDACTFTVTQPVCVTYTGALDGCALALAVTSVTCGPCTPSATCAGGVVTVTLSLTAVVSVTVLDNCTTTCTFLGFSC